MTAALAPARGLAAARGERQAGADVLLLRPRPPVAARSLAEARVRCGMTLTELARTLHVSRTTVSLWERNERRPAHYHRVGLAAALGLSPEDLAGLLAASPPARLDAVPLPSLAAARRRAHLSQRSLAGVVGVAPTTLSMWENAGVRVPPAAAARLAEVLATEVRALRAVPAPQEDADPRPLRRLRRSTRMTQSEAAAHLGISIGSLARYEAGTRRPPVVVARRMAAAYRRPPAELLVLCGVELAPLPAAARWRPEELAAGLRAARLRAGFTKAALGRAVSRSDQAVGSWERGRSRPAVGVRRRLEAVLGVLPRDVG